MALTLTLGIFLAVGVLSISVAGIVNLPKVTLYILAGLVLGPSLLGVIPHEHLVDLDPVLKLALALVLFSVGSRFTFKVFGQVIKLVWPLALGELVATFLFVSIGMAGLGVEIGPALLLGVLALATAPATTILVLQEYDSEGPVTNSIYALVALNNLAAIIFFELLFLPVSMQYQDGTVNGSERILWLTTDLVGSVVMGLIGGVVVSLSALWLSGKARDLAVVAALTVVLGVCETAGIPYLLTFLAMGVTVANSSEFVREIVHDLDKLGVLLYTTFFVAAGAELNLHAVWMAGVAGVGYVLFRVAGKCLGIGLMARITNQPLAVQRWLGLGLIAQAGVAIGLVQVAREHVPELGNQLHTIIVGTVVFFELVGPAMTGLAIVRSGEVPLVHVLKPQRPRFRELWRSVFDYSKNSVGKDPWNNREPQSLCVGDLMRRNVRTLPISANFVEILSFIEQDRHKTYPVVDADAELYGVIRYPSIHNALFDRELANLVLAEDLSVPIDEWLVPEQSLDTALRLFQKSQDDLIPVVASVEKHILVGIVEQRDVLRVMKRRQLNPDK